MKVITSLEVAAIKPERHPELREAIQNTQYLSAWPASHTPDIGLQMHGTVIAAGTPLALSSHLPTIYRDTAAGQQSQKIGLAETKAVIQEALLPVIRAAFPNVPAVQLTVKGLLFGFALKDYIDSISADTRDVTKSTIKGVRAIQKAADLFLSFGSPPALAGTLNEMGAIFISSADTIYAIQAKTKQ
jgi:hypothetical protein